MMFLINFKKIRGYSELSSALIKASGPYISFSRPENSSIPQCKKSIIRLLAGRERRQSQLLPKSNLPDFSGFIL